jgi:ABC superfamily ATP binding cassette transporter, binding protein
MKKSHPAIALGLATVLSLGLAACGSAPTSSASSSGGSGTTSDFKACMVSDEGGFDDQSFNQSGKEGLDRAGADFGIETVAVESKSAADYPTNVDSLIQQECNLIIGVGFNLADDMTKAAKQNPDAQFTEAGLPNAKPLIFNTAEAAYLAGYAAAGTTKTGKVATYGGQAIPTVQIFMEGFAKGVEKYNADNGASVQVLGWDPANPSGGSFVGDFSNTAKGQQLTEQFLSQGADIIMPVAGPVGQGTLAAVKAAGGDSNAIVWVDADGYLTTGKDGGAPYMLTSVIKEIGTAVYDTVDEAQRGAFSATPYVGTLGNQGVALAPYHDWDSKVSPELKTKIDELKKQIVDGTLDVSTAYDPS